MILSTASARIPRNLETGKTVELIPAALRGNAENLISFIDHYYKHLNTQGLPSCEINKITTEHDIDRVSASYLDAIQNEIAKGVPNSKVLDRVSLYKKIVKYYSTRGSGESAITFFRIFFDEVVNIFYPKDFLFIPSEGNWDEDRDAYLDRKGFASDVNKLRDGVYWQEFSYEIQSGLNVNDWQNEFMRMVHPAGLKLFAAMILVLFRSNTWLGSPDAFAAEDPAKETKWLEAMIPPWITDGSPGFHSPTYQPGWLSGNRRRVKIFLEAFLFANQDGNPSGFDRLVIVALKMGLQATEGRNAIVRREYQGLLKWFDSATIGSFSDKTLEDAIESYSENNNCDFLNLSSYVDFSLSWDYASYEPGSSSPPSGWTDSSYEPGSSSPPVGWTDSSLET